MGIFRKKSGQSLTEFALIFPFFMLFVLGLVQLSIIFMNSLILRYVAYMTARVAVVYEKQEIRQKKADSAVTMLKLMMASANSMNKNPVSLDSATEGVLGFASDQLGNFIGGLSGDQQNAVTIEKENFTNSKAGEKCGGDEMAFIRVTVTYHMPLRVPFVNKIFGLFGTDLRLDPQSLLTDCFTGNIFNHNASEWAKVGSNFIMPYYTLKAQAVMRVG